MPHLTFEYSANLGKLNVKPLLKEVHQLLTAQLPAKLTACQSQIIPHQDYLIGDGDGHYAFINLTIWLLKGRQPELLAAISQEIFDKISAYYHELTEQFHLKISVAIHELPPTYTYQ